MSDLDALNRLTEAYDGQVHAIRQQITAFGQAYWDSLPHYRASAIEDMIEAITPRVIAGQLRVADLTRAYLARCAVELGWKVVLPPIDQDEIIGARGVDPRTVYRRPAVDVYTALAAGKPLPQAAAEGRLRLTQLIGGDTQLAKVHAARQSMRGYPEEGQFYRRVLTGRENCALCVVASTQRYYRGDLLPIHPGCDCGVQPLPPGLAVNQVIDEDLLEQVHQIAADRLGVSDRGGRTPDYRKLLTISEHGEYGPTLSWAAPKAKPKPKTKAGGAEPPKPPKPPKAQRGTSGEQQPPESPAQRLARQKRLKSDLSALAPGGKFGQEILESHEIDFLERFEARGERARWIRRDRATGKSTNDFYWETNGDLACELKSSSAKYKPIKSLIQHAVLKARDNHGVVKDVFVIDLGARKMSVKLRQQLSQYNKRVVDGQIRRLFVMHTDGTVFEEIQLESK